MVRASSKNAYRFKRHDDIGATGAEEDDKFLRDCFVDTGDLETLLDPDDKHVVVLGRTGTGKSALLLQVADRHSPTIALAPENLALSYISNSNVLEFFDRVGVNLDPFFKLLWRHTITVEILNHHFVQSSPPKNNDWLPQKLRSMFLGPSLEDKRAKEAVDYLEKWGETFWQETEYRVKEITSRLESNLTAKAAITQKLGISTADLSASIADGLSQEEKADIVNRGQTVVREAQVQDLSKVLDLLSAVLTNRQQIYYVTVDKLDENWLEERLRYKLIMALVQTARDFLKVKNAKIILALRRDLVERVFRFCRDSGFQEEKYHSLYLPLEWNKASILDVLDRRVNHLVKNQYTTREVTHSDLLPPMVNRVPTGEYLFRRAPRPRDIITYFNTCIEYCEGKPKINVQALRKAEGVWSRARLRALGDEWSGDFPDLLDFSELLQKQFESFKVNDIQIDRVEDLCLQRAIADAQGDGQLQQIARKVVQEHITPREARVEIVRVFYRVGLVGLKLSATEPVSWIDERGRAISPAEVADDTSVVVHPAYQRALGIETSGR